MPILRKRHPGFFGFARVRNLSMSSSHVSSFQGALDSREAASRRPTASEFRRGRDASLPSRRRSPGGNPRAWRVGSAIDGSRLSAIEGSRLSNSVARLEFSASALRAGISGAARSGSLIRVPKGANHAQGIATGECCGAVFRLAPVFFGTMPICVRRSG